MRWFGRAHLFWTEGFSECNYVPSTDIIIPSLYSSSKLTSTGRGGWASSSSRGWWSTACGLGKREEERRIRGNMGKCISWDRKIARKLITLAK